MRRLAAAGLVAVALAGCQSARLEEPASRPGDNSALSTMERVAVAAQRCWFAGGDSAFEGLAMSPELTSFSGRPRILAVPRGNIAGLPKLVVEASGNPARITTFGPLMGSAANARIQSDVDRWAGGDPACSSSA